MFLFGDIEEIAETEKIKIKYPALSAKWASYFEMKFLDNKFIEKIIQSPEV